MKFRFFGKGGFFCILFLIPRQNRLAILLKELSSLTSGVARNKFLSLSVYIKWPNYYILIILRILQYVHSMLLNLGGLALSPPSLFYI